MNERGQLTVQVLLYGSLVIIALAGFLVWVNSAITSVSKDASRAQALAIAEAGIEYYRWHLAHAANDFQDGTGHAGPYAHNYYDKSGNLIGAYSLEITPPATGTTIVKIRSTGTVAGDADVKKIVEVRMGIPSFAKYAAVLNANVRFGQGTEVYGQIHSNGGVRFDGIAHNLVTSALSTYQDPDHTGGPEVGVHTHVNPPPGSGVDNTYRPLESSTSTMATRADVFLIGRQLAVPAVDFAGVTSNLSQIKADARAAGYYKGPSGSNGYEIVLKTNNTFDIYKVTSLVAAPSNCSNIGSQSGWGTWSVSAKTLIGNYAIPSNGLIFIEDNVWVSGQINHSRVTIASAKFPDNASTRTSITVNNNLLYTNYDGTDVISLIAANNINIGMVSADTLRVDAALIAQNGRVGRYYYLNPYCTNSVRTSITTYGMIGSNQRYGFAYTDGTGYITRNITYDSNLLYGPPPSFPLTTDSYKIISWTEVQ